MKSNLLLKIYLGVSGGIFFLVAIFHLLRLIFQWPIIVESTTVPMELSYLGFPGSSCYTICAYWLFRKN
jgi:hypothetical protein